MCNTDVRPELPELREKTNSQTKKKLLPLTLQCAVLSDSDDELRKKAHPHTNTHTSCE